MCFQRLNLARVPRKCSKHVTIMNINKPWACTKHVASCTCQPGLHWHASLQESNVLTLGNVSLAASLTQYMEQCKLLPLHMRKRLKAGVLSTVAPPLTMNVWIPGYMTSYSKHINSNTSVYVIHQCGYASVGRAPRHTVVVLCVCVCVCDSVPPISR